LPAVRGALQLAARCSLFSPTFDPKLGLFRVIRVIWIGAGLPGFPGDLGFSTDLRVTSSVWQRLPRLSNLSYRLETTGFLVE